MDELMDLFKVLQKYGLKIIIIIIIMFIYTLYMYKGFKLSQSGDVKNICKATGCPSIMVISPNKCLFFKKKVVYMGLEFQVKDSKVCYTPLKDKCETIRNLESPKTLKQTRVFCGMVNFLS